MPNVIVAATDADISGAIKILQVAGDEKNIKQALGNLLTQKRELEAMRTALAAEQAKLADANAEHGKREADLAKREAALAEVKKQAVEDVKEAARKAINVIEREDAVTKREKDLAVIKDKLCNVVAGLKSQAANAESLLG